MTAAEAATAARKAGFAGEPLVTIVAISGAEAGFGDATNNTARPDRPGYEPLSATEIALGWQPEYSVGPLAIDLEQHGAEITEADARSFDGAFTWGYEHSAQGTNFDAWSTYTGAGLPAGTPPAYLEFMDAARAAVEATAVPDAPQTVTLDVAQAEAALAAAAQLADHGDPLQLAAGPAADQVTLTFSLPRADLLAAWPALAAVLPQ